ncbi:DUF1501 domain-containing protein [Roseimaritima ulvae]|uniref:Sulfatase n=1 Tax=Roseimaritima ulvae TaxID=980254 RepID=A0A5B9QRA2_9BACT|nr:DUF1501 domain-containing protein [Roseimaritima ulvae]QEG39576.1 hypothetical protein UC8_15720 [Roseimaritima ulvae]
MFARNDATSRRHFLATNAMSLGSVALACLLKQDNAVASSEKLKPLAHSYTLEPKPPQHPPRANAMISLWMQGGPSHIDMFDPKPTLDKYDGKTFPGQIKYDNAAQASSKVLASPWKFQPRGQCGTELSELVPHLANVVDDICLIRSMQTGVNNHGQSIQAMNTGQILTGRPVLGSWLTYGLGCETQDLPAFVALIDPGQLPVMGVENWTNGYLPSLYQGTVVRPTEPRIMNLTPPARLKGDAQARYLRYLEQLNQEHLQNHPGELDLEARIASYELAAKMQTSAKEALDLSQESAATKRMYGCDNPESKDFAERCLIARRLVERGVRCVQVFTDNQRWDNHNSIRSGLPKACKRVDQPSAALVADLKQRGLLDTTLVHWGGEMGRLPVIQNDAGAAKVGRDHNTHGFSMWLAGGGVRGGMTFGSTDEFGHKAIENPVNHFDYHATLLHLFGLDPEQLVFTQNNQQRSLLQGKGRVVHEILG